MKRILFCILCCLFFVSLFANVKKQNDIEVINLRTEEMASPMSINTSTPRLGWQIISTKNNVMQISYHLLVASSLGLLNRNEGNLWDSGVVHSDVSQWVTYAGRPIYSNTRCYWKVKITTTQGESTWSETASWNVGLLGETFWEGNWIGMDAPAPWDHETTWSRLSARYLRKEFKISKSIKQATLYIAGLGLYELFLNGNRVGSQVLAPAPTDYRKTVIYNVFDVTFLLKEKNALGITLGNGRFYTMRQNYKPYKITNFGYPKMRLNLIVEYIDGTKETISSDDSWKLNADGPIRSNNEYDGEIYDARKEFVGWALPGFNDSQWSKANRVSIPTGTLRGNMSPNMQVTDRLKPVSMVTHSNSYILDMGQNFAGWIRMKIYGGKSGDTIRLRFAETLQKDGSLYIANLRDAQCTDSYIVKGDENGREWAPRFVYHGFRYVEVTGYDHPAKNDFIGEVVNDEMKKTGSFLCSDTILNKVYQNAVWGVQSNYKGMPVDCPQRNERQPWLGDRAIGCWGESFLFENGPLYAKWMRDICEAQREDGCIPDVAPAYWNYYSDNVTWPSVLLFASDMLYTQYGNLEPIRSAYPNMKLWMEHLKALYVHEGLISRDKYGDWCVPPEKPNLIHSQDPARQTNGTLIATSYYYKMLQLMQRSASLQGFNSDEKKYASESSIVKDAFNKKFLILKKATSLVPGHLLYPDSTYYGNNTVTANLLPLAFGMVPDNYTKHEVEKNIINTIITTNNSHISTGIIGVQWLMHELTKMGRSDIAWLLATNKTYPSWGYMAQCGATTIWELWNGDTANPKMNSGNHVMLLGDLLSWCYEDLAGIATDRQQTGFKHLIMKPDFSVEDMDSVNASYETLYGKVISYWKKNSGQLEWYIKIPANTSADIYLPDGQIKQVGSGNWFFSTKIPMRDSALIKDEFLYERASFPECHASTIAEAKDGSLVASFFGGTKERNPDVCIWVCRKPKGAKLWTVPKMIADGVLSTKERKACWNPVLFQVPSGDLLLFFKIGTSVADWTGWLVRSKDGGKTWGHREPLPESILGPSKNKPIYVNGRIISPCSLEAGGWRVYFEISDNKGRSWRKVGPITAEMVVPTQLQGKFSLVEKDDREAGEIIKGNGENPIYAIQPTILKLKDGRLEVLCRTRNGRLAVSWSSDNGDSWTPLHLTDIPNNNSGIDAVTLNDGRFALVYNNFATLPGNSKGVRTPLSVAFSNDGLHWNHWITLDDSPISQYSYPSIIQGKDGTLHIVYTWRRQRIKYVQLKNNN
jgi:alpha-L-rhamnosidase